MNYFDDLIFVNFGDMQNVRIEHDRHFFDGYYGVQFVYGGMFDFALNDAPPVCVPAPKVFITCPDVSFTYGAMSGVPRDHAYVCFRGERVERYIQSGLLAVPSSSSSGTEVLLPVAYPELLLQQMRVLFRYLRTPGPGLRERAVLKLEEILLMIQEQSSAERVPAPRIVHDFQAFRDRIAEKPCENWDFRKLAEKSGFSYVHFRRLFHQVTGCAPKHFLLECRLFHAENLLLHTNLRIGEIAERCRFEDEFHFSRFFKKTRGCSPTAFRNLYGTH